MTSSSRVEIETFYGQNFELWELKMEDKLDRKERSTIHLCLLDLVSLNVFGQDSAKKLWEIGNMYQSKSMVNKLFLQKKLYHLRMADSESMTNHLNVFNTLVSKLTLLIL